jgi:hypothetical protein
MKYTIEDLKRMSPEQRAQLYQNARNRLEAGGQAIIDLIDASGLPLSDGGIRNTDPAYLTMEELAWSSEGKRLLVEAVEAGLPALAGIEPLIVTTLGKSYHPHDGGTVAAGYIVAAVMRHLDFIENGQGNMPTGSVAQTAMKWKRR